MNKILYWLPRILSILVTAFWCFYVFASHGLSMATLLESGIWVALLFFTILAWRGLLIGKLGFLAMGVLYLIMTKGQAPIQSVVYIAGPLFLIGLLYFFDNKPSIILNKKMLDKKISLEKSKEIENKVEQDNSEFI